jgi:type IV pilus assembly protein PilY1
MVNVRDIFPRGQGGKRAMRTQNISYRWIGQKKWIVFLFSFCMPIFLFPAKGHADLPSYVNTMVVSTDIGTGGAPLLSASSGEGDILYQALYQPRKENGIQRHWVGNILKYVYKTDIETPGYELSDSWKVGAEKVGAATILAEKSPSQRKIYTSSFQDVIGNSTTSMVLLNNDLVNDSSKRAKLANEIGITDSELTGGFKRFIQWYRGCNDIVDANPDDKGRDDKLFDIFHSGLVIVGPPNAGISDSAYTDFLQLYNDPDNGQIRKTLIYAQSNAGLLHAFSHADGQEEWAFLPPNVREKVRLKGLKWIGNDYREYNDSTKESVTPRYLADGPTVAEDAYFASSQYTNVSGDNKYHTVLFAQLGFGGAGMYALEISDPDVPKFLWAVENPYESGESTIVWRGSGRYSGLSDYDYQHLRQTGSTAFVGFYKNASGEPCWVFLMGNGAQPNNNSFKQSLVYVGRIFDGSIVKIIYAPSAGQKAPIVTPVAVPMVFENNNAIPRQIKTFYVGDAKGRLMKGDLSNPNPNNWGSMTNVWTLPSTWGMSYTLDAATLDGEVWLFTGTGDLERYVTPPQGVTDNYFFGINANKINPNDNYKNTLQDLGELGTAANDNQKGWYMVFPLDKKANTVESLSTAPVVVNGILYFATNRLGVKKKGNLYYYTGEVLYSKMYAIHAKTGLPGWEWKTGDTTFKKRYFEIEKATVSGISLSGKRLAIGVTFQDATRNWEHPGFTVLGSNILYINDITGGNDGGESSVENYRIMTPLYWKTR